MSELCQAATAESLLNSTDLVAKPTDALKAAVRAANEKCVRWLQIFNYKHLYFYFDFEEGQRINMYQHIGCIDAEFLDHCATLKHFQPFAETQNLVNI